MSSAISMDGKTTGFRAPKEIKGSVEETALLFYIDALIGKLTKGKCEHFRRVIEKRCLTNERFLTNEEKLRLDALREIKANTSLASVKMLEEAYTAYRAHLEKIAQMKKEADDQKRKEKERIIAEVIRIQERGFM